jgi:putative ubiquitin-RnfH superfamily antitoxin RatB of RatAB toxin-antitoxin module
MAMLRITVAHSPGPRQVVEQVLELPPGATVLQALQQAGLAAAVQGGELQVAVWGRKAAPGQLLRERDRVEVLRPLKVDPKVARRERFRQQGARAAGLFAKKRAGAKPGY